MFAISQEIQMLIITRLQTLNSKARQGTLFLIFSKIVECFKDSVF